MIPTAEEFLKQVSPNDEFGLRINLGNSKKHIHEIMCRFAKLHVESALQSASKNAKRKKVYNGHPQRLIVKRVIDKESILNAYPLTNIK